jgi:hypothetical protein
MGRDFKESLVIWLLHYNVIILLLRCRSTDNIATMMLFAVISSLRLVHYLSNVHTWDLLLEALREYVQHGPLVSINWLRLCPQFWARVRSHAVRRRLFIVLMTAAHISPKVFSLWNFLSNIHVLFLAYVHRHSYLLYITFKQYLHPFNMRLWRPPWKEASKVVVAQLLIRQYVCGEIRGNI